MWDTSVDYTEKLSQKNKRFYTVSIYLDCNNIFFKRISMFKQFKAVKALALVAAFIGSGQLSAVITSGSSSGATTTSKSVSGSLAYSANAYDSVATTASSVVTEASVMAIKVTKIMGLVGAVTAEAAEAMRGSDSSAATSGSDAGVKIASSTGSAHRASTWIRASVGFVDNAAKDQQWNGKSYLTMVGADYKFNNMFCAGLGLSYSHLDARTEFNKGTMKQDTLGVNPYLIIVPHKNFNVEFVGGWSTTTGKDTRRWVATAENGINRVNIDNVFSCSPKSKAMFGGVFANFVNKVNKASFNLQVGYLMMQSKMDKFKETSASSAYAGDAKTVPSNTFKAQTAVAKILVGYQMTPSVMPFVNIHGQYDVKENKGVTYEKAKKYSVNRSAFGGGTGVQVKNDDQLSGSLQFDYTKRGQLSTYVTGLRVHYGF